MGRKLRITRRRLQPEEEKESITYAKDLMTDPCDPNTGIASHWGTMVNEMELETVHTKDGVKARWKRK